MQFLKWAVLILFTAIGSICGILPRAVADRGSSDSTANEGSGYLKAVATEERIVDATYRRIDDVNAYRVDGVDAYRVDGVDTDRVDGVDAYRVDQVDAYRVDGVDAGWIDEVDDDVVEIEIDGPFGEEVATSRKAHHVSLP